MSRSMKRQVEFGRVFRGRGNVGNVLPVDTSVKSVCNHNWEYPRAVCIVPVKV